MDQPLPRRLVSVESISLCYSDDRHGRHSPERPRDYRPPAGIPGERGAHSTGAACRTHDISKSQTVGSRRRPLRQVVEAIQASREVLRLGEGWNGENAAAISEDTWGRAIEFLFRNAQLLWSEHGVPIEAPRLVPVPDGTLDIHWKVAKRELLVNIPSRAGERAKYYTTEMVAPVIMLWKATWTRLRRTIGSSCG